MCVFPCIVLTPFEPWFVVVFVNYCLLYWFCWLVSLIRLTAFLLFLVPFPGLVDGLPMSVRIWTPHTPKSAQICLRWLNRLKTEPVAFPACTTMPAGKLWIPSEFPEGCSAHLELRTESGELRGMITFAIVQTPNSQTPKLPSSVLSRKMKTFLRPPK